MLDVVGGGSEKLLVRCLMEIREVQRRSDGGGAADGEVPGEIAGGSGGGLGGEGRRKMGVGERRMTMGLKKTEKKKSCAANLPYALIRCLVPNQAEFYTHV